MGLRFSAHPRAGVALAPLMWLLTWACAPGSPDGACVWIAGDIISSNVGCSEVDEDACNQSGFQFMADKTCAELGFDQECESGDHSFWCGGSGVGGSSSSSSSSSPSSSSSSSSSTSSSTSSGGNSCTGPTSWNGDENAPCSPTSANLATCDIAPSGDPAEIWCNPDTCRWEVNWCDWLPKECVSCEGYKCIYYEPCNP